MSKSCDSFSVLSETPYTLICKNIYVYTVYMCIIYKNLGFLKYILCHGVSGMEFSISAYFPFLFRGLQSSAMFQGNTNKLKQ